jgi:hypothetical protein
MGSAGLKSLSIAGTRVRDGLIAVSLAGKVITLSPEGDTDVTTQRTNDSGYAIAWIFRKHSGCVCLCCPSVVPVCPPRSGQSQRGGTAQLLSVFDQREEVLPFDDNRRDLRNQVFLRTHVAPGLAHTAAGEACARIQIARRAEPGRSAPRFGRDPQTHLPRLPDDDLQLWTAIDGRGAASGLFRVASRNRWSKLPFSFPVQESWEEAFLFEFLSRNRWSKLPFSFPVQESWEEAFLFKFLSRNRWSKLPFSFPVQESQEEADAKPITPAGCPQN